MSCRIELHLVESSIHTKQMELLKKVSPSPFGRIDLNRIFLAWTELNTIIKRSGQTGFVFILWEPLIPNFRN